MAMSKLTHQPGYAWKFNHKNKSSRCKIPSNRFTIFMNQSSYNDNFNPQKYSDDKEPYYEKQVRPDPICYDSPPEHHHCCIPRCGELMINGDFENRPDPFLGWVIKAGVEDLDPDIGELAHQGLNAARLGFPSPHATLYQDVPGICPGIFYQLNFYLSAATECGNAPVNVRMEFLDHRKYLLDRPVIQILIPGDSLNSAAFTGFNNSTRVPAPPEARFARISFEINTHNHKDRCVHLDDVSLIAIWNPREAIIDI
jgi:hypothetical protein